MKWKRVSEILPEENENVLWIKVPVCEPPYCGTMLDISFIDDYYTHWIELPELPKEY